MPLIAGDPDCTTGLAKDIRDALLAASGSGATDNAALKATCFAIATAVVTHITTHAAVITACPAGAGTGTVT